MSVDERTRHELRQRLDDVLGIPAAETLMTYLPPLGWAEMATKRDLDGLEQRMNLRFEAVGLKFEAVEHKFEAALQREVGTMRGEIGTLRGEIGSLRGEIGTQIAAQTRTLFFSTSGLMLTLAGLTYAATRLG